MVGAVGSPTRTLVRMPVRPELPALPPSKELTRTSSGVMRTCAIGAPPGDANNPSRAASPMVALDTSILQELLKRRHRLCGALFHHPVARVRQHDGPDVGSH